MVFFLITQHALKNFYFEDYSILISFILIILIILMASLELNETEAIEDDSDDSRNGSTPNPKKTKHRPCHKLTSSERRELVECLLAIPSIANNLETVIKQLPDEIKFNITNKSSKIIHVFNMVNTCLEYPAGIEKLSHILQFLEGNSISMKRFKKTLNRLCPREDDRNDK